MSVIIKIYMNDDQSFPNHSALDDVRQGLEFKGGTHSERTASLPNKRHDYRAVLRQNNCFSYM